MKINRYILSSACCLQVREAARELGLQPDPGFCLKVGRSMLGCLSRWCIYVLLYEPEHLS
jgi:hypothetical protein